MSNLIVEDESIIITENLCESLTISIKKEQIYSSTAPEVEAESHYLDEYPIDIELEKKYLDSYSLRNEDPRKKIKIQNYNVTQAETCKDTFSQILKKVINSKVTTVDTKPSNYADDVKYIISAKNQANKIINTHPDLAIEEYNKLLLELNNIFRSVKDERLFESDPDLKELINQKKLIYSNMALAYTLKGLYKKAIELDLYILKDFPNFDKSYARLITSYMKIDNMYMAQQYAERLRNFDQSTISKYDNILTIFDENMKKYEEKSGIKNLFKKSKKNEEIAIKKEEQKKEEEAKKNITVKPSKHSNWLSAFLGGLIFAGSSFGLFFLFKFRKNFTK